MPCESFAEMLRKASRGRENFLTKVTGLKTSNQAANLVMVPGEENLQCPRLYPENKPYLQPGTAFKNVFSQTADGDSGMRVGPAKAIRQHRERVFHTGNLVVGEIFETSLKTRAEQ